MSTGFLLLETLPGREGSVVEALSRIPGVTHRNTLFPGAVAVRVEGPALDPLLAQLRRLEGVVGSRAYRARTHT